MKEIKFQFIYQGKPYNGTNKERPIVKKVYSLDEIANNGLPKLCDVHGFMELIAKRQYTGLKDKNGKEIYEGDIVHADGNNSNYTVKFGEHELSSHYDSSPHICTGFYLLRHNGLSFNEIESIGGDCSYLEVIGNIYENKELLNDES